MSYKRFDEQDIVVSAESVTAPVWSGDVTTLTTFFTSSTQIGGTSADYYYDIYQTGSGLDTSRVQFSIAYADKLGSGSLFFNSAVTASSPAATIYGQYRNLILGDEESNFTFGNITSEHFYAIAVDRARYKEALLPGTLALKLHVSGSGEEITLTDNSQIVTTTTFTDAGRVYQIVSGSETICMYSRPTSFGPPCGGGDDAQGEDSSGFGGDALVGYNAPFTPPYYDGAAWVDIEYTPTTSSPSLKDVLGSTTSSYLRYEGWTSNGAGSATGPQNGSGININATQISASVNLFGSTNGLKDLMKYTAAGNIEGEEQWVIQTKFETPILNFIDATDQITMIQDIDPFPSLNQYKGGLVSRPFGMWHQYGRIPSGSEGVSLEVLDIEGYASLADIVGFAKTSENLGKVAKSKTIREAVVAVPFIEVKNQRKFFDLSSNSSGNDMNLPQAPSDSVAKMIDSMGRYVFPPSMDFVKYPEEVKPFTMYIFEFEHQLNQQDLVDIWQNLPPRIGRAFDAEAPLDSSEIMQEKQITHSLVDGELLKKVDSKLQWMIFKVKQRASVNYWDKSVSTNPSLTEASVKDATLPLAGIDGVLKGTGGDFNYNWPYDFFSLVELVKMDEEVEFKKGSTKVATSVNQNQALGTNLTQQNTQAFSAPETVNKIQAVGTNLTQQGVETPEVAESVNKTQTMGSNLTQQGASGYTEPAKNNNLSNLK